jgi:hypothetical protein
MSAKRWGPALAPVPLLLVVAAGCGGGARHALPGCVHAASAVSAPSRFPLPDGAVLDSRRRQGGASVYTGYAPGELEANRDFFRRELPKRGFRLGEGDAEEDEAETDFSGNGVDGHLRLHAIDGCEGAVSVAVVVR